MSVVAVLLMQMSMISSSAPSDTATAMAHLLATFAAGTAGLRAASAGKAARADSAVTADMAKSPGSWVARRRLAARVDRGVDAQARAQLDARRQVGHVDAHGDAL